MDDCAAEMPKYRSHKVVHALKIRALEKRDGPDGLYSIWLVPEEEGYAPFALDRAYIAKHDPQPGGYFVVYDDGYKSWSPAQAFEEGYTRI